MTSRSFSPSYNFVELNLAHIPTVLEILLVELFFFEAVFLSCYSSLLITR